jgi:hypothetical protein
MRPCGRTSPSDASAAHTALDLRPAHELHFTLKTKPLKCADLDEFVALFNPANRHERKAT